MMRWTILLALLALPTAAAAQDKVRTGDFRAMSSQRIADAILPADHVPIAAAIFERLGGFPFPAGYAPPIRTVRFFTASAPISADFCLQSEIVAEITPMPDAEDAWMEAPPRLVRATAGRQLYRYRAPDEACDGTRPHFSVYGMPASRALDAYRALVGAVRLAGARPARPLPYGVSCEGIFCGSGRDEMRGLPYADIVAVEPQRRDLLGGRGRLARLGRLPSRDAVLFDLPMLGTRKTDIIAILHDGRIEQVAVQRSEVVF